MLLSFSELLPGYQIEQILVWHDEQVNGTRIVAVFVPEAGLISVYFEWIPVALRLRRRYAPGMTSLTLKTQEIALDHPDSTNMFQPSPDKPLVATPAAIGMYQQHVIIECIQVLQQLARDSGGLDYLRAGEFQRPTKQVGGPASNRRPQKTQSSLPPSSELPKPSTPLIFMTTL